MTVLASATRAFPVCLSILALLLPAAALAAPGMVVDEVKVGDGLGGFGGVLSDDDRFGSAAAPLGDLDGDSVGDLAVGAIFDDDGGTDRGAVWILFLNADGTVKSEQKISDTAGGFGGVLDDEDNFGASLATLGDVDGDGVVDLAVGAPTDDDGGTDRGAVWILFLNTNGTVKSEQKISDLAGSFGGTLANEDLFGSSLAAFADLDGDGIEDLVSGATGDSSGVPALPLEGALWVLFLDTDGTVKSEQKINEANGGFGGSLDFFDQFGWALGTLEDLDGDGVDDLAAGLATDAIWILFMNVNGTVKSEQKISDTEGGFGGAPGSLGWGLAQTHDVDGDGIRDLAVGAAGDDDGGTNRGAVWLLFMDSDGTVLDEQKISSTDGGLVGPLADGDQFGFSVAYLGDSHPAIDLAAGAFRDAGAGTDRGAVWMLTVAGPAQDVPALEGPAVLALIAGLAAAGRRFAPRRRSA